MAPVVMGGPSRRHLLAVALLSGPVAGFVHWWWFESGDRADDLARSSAVVVVFLVFFFTLTGSIGKDATSDQRRKFGYLEVLIGADGFASTSKTAVWLWTVIFASALVLLAGMVWWGELSVQEAYGSDWDSYLLLLGGPFASAVLAKGITANKAEMTSLNISGAASDSAVGTAAPAGSDVSGPKITDLGKGNNGDGSMADTQYVVFTLVAMIFFVGSFIQRLVSYGNGELDAIQLPPIPAALLGLTGLTALTYVGAKVTESSGLRLAQTTPHNPKEGTELHVALVNLPVAVSESMITVHYADPATKEEKATRAPSQNSLKRSDPFVTFDVALPIQGTYDMWISTPQGRTASTTVEVAAP